MVAIITSPDDTDKDRSPKTRDKISVTTTDVKETNFELSTTSDDNVLLFYFLTTPYIQKSLIEYQYNGQDLSLLYKYILSPLASLCVYTLIPKYIAPNAITLTGLCCMICAYCIMWYHVPLLFTTNTTTFETDAEHEGNKGDTLPRYIFLCNAIAILLYQTLDNMDGKQARRICASSPLGLYFDHGCDAINSVFGSANWIITLGLSTTSMIAIMDSWYIYIMLIGPYALFYWSTWEEYYTGQLIMPIVNGPNEGLLGAVIVSLISYFHGPSYWHQYDWWESICILFPFVSNVVKVNGLLVNVQSIRNCDIFICITAICMIQEIVLKTISILRRYGFSTIWNLIPFITMATCTVIVYYCNPNIWYNMPRTSLHLSSILFVEMTTDLMLRHMTKQSYQPIRLVMIPLVVFTILIMMNVWPYTYITIDQFLIMYTSIAGTYLVIKTIIVIHEMCTVLNIWCFTTGPRNAKKDTNSIVVNALQNSKLSKND